RKQIIVVSALSIIMLHMAGCSMLGRKGGNPVIGTWSAIYTLEDAEVIFGFKPDMTMTCTVPEAPENSFTADYSINMSTKPATIDLVNITSGALPDACLGIIQFPDSDSMEFMGTFGDAGQVSRPSEFRQYEEIPNIYLYFRKRDN
ncbi:hypothetical protein ACFL55_02650, partial [Candidatus Latescibacterota bacterium]